MSHMMSYRGSPDPEVSAGHDDESEPENYYSASSGGKVDKADRLQAGSQPSKALQEFSALISKEFEKIRSGRSQDVEFYLRKACF